MVSRRPFYIVVALLYILGIALLLIVTWLSMFRCYPANIATSGQLKPKLSLMRMAAR